MHVRPASVQKQVRNAPGQDENDKNARGDEGEEKGEEDVAREPAYGRRIVDRVHTGLGANPEKGERRAGRRSRSAGADGRNPIEIGRNAWPMDFFRD